MNQLDKFSAFTDSITTNTSMGYAPKFVIIHPETEEVFAYNLTKKDNERIINALSKKDDLPCDVVTASMGSCLCGDCFCSIYSDGTIRYWGNENWQKSERRPFLFENEPTRPYQSQLAVGLYKTVMNKNGWSNE